MNSDFRDRLQQYYRNSSSAFPVQPSASAAIKTLPNYSPLPKDIGTSIQRVINIVKPVLKPQFEREAFTCFLLADIKMPKFSNYEPESIMEHLKFSSMECQMALCLMNVWHNHSAFVEWHIFEKTVITLNDREINPLINQEITPCEIAYAITVMRMVDKDSKFSDEVIKYISVMLYHDGFFKSPHHICDEISMNGVTVQKMLNTFNKGTDGDMDFHDNVLIDAVDKYVDARLAKMKSELDEEKIDETHFLHEELEA